MNTQLENCVVADVGGTNARFALVDKHGALKNITVLPTSDYPGPEQAIADYLSRVGLSAVSAICFAIACPVQGEIISMSNNHWSFARSALENSLGAPLLLINDFAAQALCLRDLHQEHIHWLGSPRPEPGQMKAVVGPGTGLGVAMLSPDGVVFPTEGGHSGFAPASAHQINLVEILRQKYSRISLERLISGQGLENLFWANSILDGEEKQLPAQQITSLAHSDDSLAKKTIADFFEIFAAACGDMALNYGSEGGVYLTGGVMEKLSDFLDEDSFRHHFENKGRFAEYCAAIPVGIMNVENPGLLGCAAALRSHFLSL